MTTNRGFDRELSLWLEAEASMSSPGGLHEAVIGRAGRSRQRPRWLVAVRGGTIRGPMPSAGRRSLILVSLPMVVVLLVAALATAVVVGSLLSDPPRPWLGRNGAIAYSVFEDGGHATGQSSGLHVMNADGSGDRRVGTGTCPSYSGDGAWTIHRSAWNSAEVVVEAVDGSARTIVLAEDDHLHPASRPYALSPDGTMLAWLKPVQEIVFSFPDGSSEGGRAKNELWVSPASGGPGVRLVPASGVPNESFWDPTWSPDGRRIAFQTYVAAPSTDGGGHGSGVRVVDVDGSHLERLTARPAGRLWAGLSWSPDGRSLAYVGLPDGVPLPTSDTNDPAYRDPPLDIFIVGADGSGEVNVTRSPANERHPAWSPDGTRLAYETSDDGESYRLAVLRMDDEAFAQAPTLGPASGAFAWSPDGTMLVSALANDIRTIDAALLRPPTRLIHVEPTDGTRDFGIELDCPPSWQRLEP